MAVSMCSVKNYAPASMADRCRMSSIGKGAISLMVTCVKNLGFRRQPPGQSSSSEWIPMQLPQKGPWAASGGAPRARRGIDDQFTRRGPETQQAAYVQLRRWRAGKLQSYVVIVIVIVIFVFAVRHAAKFLVHGAASVF